MLKDCNFHVIKKGYLDRPPWPAGISVSAKGISFEGGSKAKEKEEFEKQGIKESFFISLLKKIFTFLTPLLVSIEFLYPPLFRQLLLFYLIVFEFPNLLFFHKQYIFPFYFTS